MRARVAVLSVVASAALAGLPATTAVAAAAPAVTSVSVAGRGPGDLIRATGTGFAVGTPVDVTLDGGPAGAPVSLPLATATPDPAGTVTLPADTRVPLEATPGGYRVTMTQPGGVSASAPTTLSTPQAVISGVVQAGRPAITPGTVNIVSTTGLANGPGVTRTVTVDGEPVPTAWFGDERAFVTANTGFGLPADLTVGKPHRVVFTQTGPTPVTIGVDVTVQPPELDVRGGTSPAGRIGISVSRSGWDDVVDLTIVGAAGDSHGLVVEGADDATPGGVFDLPNVSPGLATITSVSRHNGATATATFTIDPATVTAPNGLAPGARVVSANGSIEVDMQTDGNLVLRDYGSARWSSRTAGNRGARLVVQSDGNVVVRAADGRALWSTGTSGIGTRARFGLAADGNLVVTTASGRTTWSTFTYGGAYLDRLTAGQYLFENQVLFAPDVTFTLGGDGNVVLRQLQGPALWTTRTAGHPNAYLVLQTDGNLVLRAPNGAVLWANGVRGVAGARVVAQGDGNVVEYAPNGRAVWSTRTHL